MFVNRLFTLWLALALAGCTTASYTPNFVDSMPDAEFAQLQLAQSKPATGSVFANDQMVFVVDSCLYVVANRSGASAARGH